MAITDEDMLRTADLAAAAAEEHYYDNPVHFASQINLIKLAVQAEKESGGELPVVLYSIYLTAYSVRYTMLVCGQK